jgi:hypothetical protein
LVHEINYVGLENAVKTPGFGDRRKYVRRYTILTGNWNFRRRGYTENTTIEMCKIQKITMTKTTLIVGSGEGLT